MSRVLKGDGRLRLPPSASHLKRHLPSVAPTVICSSFSHTISQQQIRYKIPTWERVPFDFEGHVRTMSEDKFKRRYRLSISSFRCILGLLRPVLSRKENRAGVKASTVSPETMLCVTMRLRAGASYLDVGWPYGVGDSTVYSIFGQTLSALETVLEPARFPFTDAECRQEAEKFCYLRKSPLRGIIAAIDGIAIAIRQPSLRQVQDPRKYFNRKGFFVLSVQAAVCADYRICFLSTRHAGSSYDSTAFHATMVHRIFKPTSEAEIVVPRWAMVAADDAYANGGHVLTPYGGYGPNACEDNFNYYLSSCRITVEQVFGMIVGWFGIFWSPLRCKVSRATLIVTVCCRLHNFILKHADTFEKYDIPFDDEDRIRGQPTVWIQSALHLDNPGRRVQRVRADDDGVRRVLSRLLEELGYVRPQKRQKL